MSDSPRPTAEEILAADHRWYHAIDLAPGVVTPGWIDLRRFAAVPDFGDLKGLRALDVGTFDGFWAFEMERCGARVVAIDIDDIPPKNTPIIHRPRLVEEAGQITPGTGFALLKRYFDSGVERVSCDVMELSVERVGGPVDVAFLGAFLLHMRDPVGALERVRDVLVPGGRLILFEPIEPKLSKKKEPLAKFLAVGGAWTYWYPNRNCLEHWATTAGFTEISISRKATEITNSEGLTQHLVVLNARWSGGPST